MVFWKMRIYFVVLSATLNFLKNSLIQIRSCNVTLAVFLTFNVDVLDESNVGVKHHQSSSPWTHCNTLPIVIAFRVVYSVMYNDSKFNVPQQPEGLQWYINFEELYITDIP